MCVRVCHSTAASICLCVLVRAQSTCCHTFALRSEPKLPIICCCCFMCFVNEKKKRNHFFLFFFSNYFMFPRLHRAVFTTLTFECGDFFSHRSMDGYGVCALRRIDFWQITENRFSRKRFCKWKACHERMIFFIIYDRNHSHPFDVQLIDYAISMEQRFPEAQLHRQIVSIRARSTSDDFDCNMVLYSRWRFLFCVCTQKTLALFTCKFALQTTKKNAHNFDSNKVVCFFSLLTI